MSPALPVPWTNLHTPRSSCYVPPPPLPSPLPRLEMKFESGLLMRHHENQIGRASVNTLNGDFRVVSVCETRVKSFTVLKSKFAAVFFLENFN